MSHSRRIPVLAFALFLFLPCMLTGCARETTAEHAANVYAAQEMAAAPLHGNLPDYSLPPDKLAKAQKLVSYRETIHFATRIWGIISLLLLLGLGVIGWMRDTALRVGHNKTLQKIAISIAFIELATCN